jgi:hypothetical protein
MSSPACGGGNGDDKAGSFPVAGPADANTILPNKSGALAGYPAGQAGDGRREKGFPEAAAGGRP